MSFSVNGSNANNPFALWQSLLQPDSSASNSAQSDPIASLLAALGQGQGAATGATASSGGAGSSSTSSAVTSGSSSPQFGAQTLQTLFDMQANASNSQSLPSPLGGSAGPDDSYSSPQAQPSQPGHHHHHHAGSANDGSNLQNLPPRAPRRQIRACLRCRLARKTVVFHGFASRPRFCIATAGRAWRSVTCAGVFHVVFRQRFERQ